MTVKAESKEEIYQGGRITETTNLTGKFKAGDKVIFTNEFGREFKLTILGFSVPNCNWTKGKNRLNEPLFIHLYGKNCELDGHAWWYPHGLSEIRKA